MAVKTTLASLLCAVLWARAQQYPAASTWRMANENEALMWVVKDMLGPRGAVWSSKAQLTAVTYPIKLIADALQVALADKTEWPDLATRYGTHKQHSPEIEL